MSKNARTFFKSEKTSWYQRKREIYRMKCLLVKLAHISRRNDIIISGVYLVCSIYVRPDLAAANERRPIISGVYLCVCSMVKLVCSTVKLARISRRNDIIISGVYLVCSICVRPDLAAANEGRPFISGVYLVCSIWKWESIWAHQISTMLCHIVNKFIQ